MTDHDYSCPMLRGAEENDNGRLIYTKEYEGPAGGNREKEIDCTAIYSPGRRKTSDVDLLVMEARMAAEGKELGNPAFPTRGEVAEKVHDRLGDDVQPAWMTCPPKEFP